MKIFFNPKCSTCRNALALLEERGIEPQIVKYLETPPSREELVEIIAMLGIKPIDLVRAKESVWQDNYKGKELSDDQVVDAMLAHPVLIERPILVSDEKAMVCRPFDKAREF